MIPLTEVKYSKADLTSEPALQLTEALPRLYPDWIAYHSMLHKDVWELATQFTNNHSKIETKEHNIYSRAPLLLTRGEERDGSIVEGLIYTNGAVVLQRKDNDYIATWLYVDQETIKTFKYPLPETIIRDL